MQKENKSIFLKLFLIFFIGIFTFNNIFSVDTTPPEITFLGNFTDGFEYNFYEGFTLEDKILINDSESGINHNRTKFIYNNNIIYPFDILTPLENRTRINNWGSYSGQTFATNQGSYTPDDFFFKDGFWYILDNNGDEIHKFYENFTYIGIETNVTSQTNDPTSISFHDGFWYLSDRTNDAIYQYYENWTYTGTNFNLSAKQEDMRDIIFHDGFWYVLEEEGSTDRVEKYYENWTSTGINFTITGGGSGDKQDMFFKDRTWYLVTGGSEEYISRFDEDFVFLDRRRVSTPIDVQSDIEGIFFKNESAYFMQGIEGAVFVFNTTINQSNFFFENPGNQTIQVYVEDNDGNNLTQNITIFVNIYENFLNIIQDFNDLNLEINQYEFFLFDFFDYINISNPDIDFVKYFYNSQEIANITLTPIEDRPVLGIKNYSGVSFDVSTEDTLPRSLYFKDDLWYLAGDLNNAIFEYYENGSYTGTSFDISAQDTTPRGIFFLDGFWYLSGSQNDNIYQYYQNWTYTGTSFDISAQDTGPTEMHFQDGFWYLVGNTNNAVFQYYQNWTYTGTSFDVSTEDTTPTGITFKDSFWYLSGGQNDNIYQYYENWTYTGISFDVSTEDTAPTGITFRDKFFGLAGDITAQIYRYNTLYNETIFRFDEIGTQNITVFGQDILGNNISRDISINVDPYQYFRFNQSNGSLVSNFTFNRTLWPGTEAKIKLSDIGLGNKTLAFEKQGFNVTNITLEFTNTSEYNLTISIPLSTIEISIYDITDFTLISGSNTTVEIIGESFSQIYTTTTGRLNISSPLMQLETYTIIVSNANYETSTINFNFNNQEIIIVNAYLTPTTTEEGVVADIIIRVLDDYQNPLRDLNVFQSVWDSGQSKYVQINLKSTDYSGETSFKVFLNTKLYNFCAIYAGTQYCKNDVTVNINTEVIVIDIPISELELPPENPIYEIDFSYSLTNSSYQSMGINYTSVTFNYDNPNQDVDEYCVKIYQIEQLKRTLVANQCDSGHSGGLSVNIIENTSNNYVAVATIEIDGSIRALDPELILYAEYQLQDELDVYGFVKIIILLAIAFVIGIAIHKKIQNIIIAHVGLPIIFLIFSIIFPIYISFQSFVLILLVNLFAYRTVTQKDDLKKEVKFTTLNSILALYMIFIFGLHTALTEINEKGILDDYGEVILQNIEGENSYFNSYMNTTVDNLKDKRADAKLGAWELLTGIFLKTLEFVDTFFSILSNLFNIATTLGLIIGIKDALLLKFIKLIDYVMVAFVLYLYFKEAFK